MCIRDSSLDCGKTNSTSINRHMTLPAELRALHQNHTSKGTRPTVADLSRLLVTATQRYSRTLILLDALDECIERTVLKTLLKELSDLREKQPVSLFVTSRDVSHITENFNEGLTLEIRARNHDLDRFVDNYVTSLPACIPHEFDLQDTIRTEIVAASDGL